jgi:hypothetical protein
VASGDHRLAELAELGRLEVLAWDGHPLSRRLEPSRVRRAESGTRGLPADADRAPIRFPRRARLYV